MSRRRLTTPDGRVVHVDVETAAARAGDLFIAGTFAYVFPSGAGANDPPIFSDSIIGAVIDSSGTLTLVPHPLPGRHVLYPRAASAGAGGWHVVFAESGVQPDGTSAAASGPLTLWHGVFAGDRWAGLERVARLAAATVSPSDASELVVQGTTAEPELAFAFGLSGPLDVLPSPDGVSGVGLLRGRPGRWRLDTLQTESNPFHVRLLAGDRPGHWVVAFSGSFAGRLFDGRWGFDRSLLVAPVTTTGWGATRTLVRSEASLVRPHVVRLGDRILATWVEAAIDGSAARSVLKYVTVDVGVALSSNPRAEPPRDAATADTVLLGTNDYAVAALGDRERANVFWVARDGSRDDRLRLALLTEDALRRLEPMSVTNHTWADLAALPPRRAFIFAATVGRMSGRADLPPAATYAHELRLECAN